MKKQFLIVLAIGLIVLSGYMVAALGVDTSDKADPTQDANGTDQSSIWVNCTEAEKQADIMCTQHYDPVCGDNGITYSNECWACMSGNVSAWTAGECPINDSSEKIAREFIENAEWYTAGPTPSNLTFVGLEPGPCTSCWTFTYEYQVVVPVILVNGTPYLGDAEPPASNQS